MELKKTKERARKEIIKETERDKNGEQKYKKKEGNKNLRRPEQGQRRTHNNKKKEEDMRNIQPNNNKMKKGRANGTEEEGEGEHQTIGSKLNEQERGKLKGL